MKKISSKAVLGIVCVSLLSIVPLAAQNFPLKVENDKLVYQCDERGNRILDFSQCGYMNSNQPIPEVPFTLFVSPVKGDNSVRIQQAIDYVASLPLNKEGVRGTVLLDKGVFELEQNLHITASGVLLMGTNKDETVLLKKGFDRSALIRIEGTMNATMLDTLTVSSPYVPVNSTTLQLTQTNNIANGARVFIVRPSTKEWIASLNCDVFGGGIGAMGWKPGDMDLCWDRTITDVKAESITIDAPLTVALDVAYGASKVILYQWSGRIAHSGVANLTLVSDYDREYPKHEDHCWTGISIEHAENCWIQQVKFKHFAGSAVVLQPTASRVTVEDCISLEPISEIGGMRRTTFLTYGQLNLFQRCYSEQGIHDFAVGYCAAGPNAFVQCESYESFGFSGAISSWSCGILFDIVNIDGNNLCFKNLGQDNNGAGWNTANSLFWQCTAAEIECYSPADDARNRAYGCWAQFSGNGDWESSNNHVRPRSLFYAQLQERLGRDVTDRARILPMSTNASTSPSVETAMKLTQEAKTPILTLSKWINEHTLTIAHPMRLKSVDELKVKKTKLVNASKKYVQLQNGRLTYDGMLLTGGKQDITMWNGKLRTPLIAKASPHLSRFVPGREGKGLTDRIDSVITYMQRKNILVLDHNYGLWYDRRRDDHERIRRRDGYAWAPFYEQPFARTNSEKPAWDGMSKYDLTKYNAWYWARLKEFADKSEQVGLLLFHQNYFQHNILEAGAHWVDSPWRTANNVNNTGFPEPVHFAGDKRIFYAEMFYDITHPVRRELHRSYIRKCLDNFADNHNVIQLISDEFTGPLHFVEFWIDVIAEWQAETGKDALVALSTTKDVQDAILSDPKRAQIVDIIDIRYWHYRSDGTVYAPEGGKNLSPRQHARVMSVGRVTFAEAYKAVSEYRTKYPDKAVTYYTQNYPAMAWAVLMAGGSCPMLPVRDEQFLRSVAQMELVKSDTGTYQKLVKSGIGCVIYSHSSGNISVGLDGGKYMLKYIDPVTGVVDVISKSLNIKDKYTLEVPMGKTGVYWFSKL